jgi:hypothetical protein
MPIILAVWETEIGRISLQTQPGQIVHEIPSLQNTQSKMDWRCGSSRIGAYFTKALNSKSSFSSAPPKKDLFPYLLVICVIIKHIQISDVFIKFSKQ